MHSRRLEKTRDTRDVGKNRGERSSPSFGQRFKNAVKVSELRIKLKGWDGTLSNLDRYLGPAQGPEYYAFHRHVEHVTDGGDEATVVAFQLNNNALPKDGPVKPVLRPPTSTAGVAHKPDSRATLAAFPSGIGMRNGGAAADAAPVAQLLRAVGVVITNPNTVHASAHNALDTENNTGNAVIVLPGTSHKEFLRGDFSLRARTARDYPDVTLITDNSASDGDMIDHLNAQMVLKGNVLADVLSIKGLGIDIGIDAKSGRAESTFADMSPLVHALDVLQREAKLQGVVLTSFNFNDFVEQQYLMHLYGLRKADGKPQANAMVNAEVSISYLVKARTGLLSMHGPGTNYDFHGRTKVLRGEIEQDRQKFIDKGWSAELLDKIAAGAPAQPNSAGEVTSSKGIGCLLPSARHTPVMLEPGTPNALTQKNVIAVTVPNGCELSETTIAAAKAGIPVLVDLSNTTIQSSSRFVRSREHLAESVMYCKTSVEMVGAVKMLGDGKTLGEVREATFEERLRAGFALFDVAGVNRSLFSDDGVLSYPRIKVREIPTPLRVDGLWPEAGRRSRL